jgi:hypothetical protein
MDIVDTLLLLRMYIDPFARFAPTDWAWSYPLEKMNFKHKQYISLLQKAWRA